LCGENIPERFKIAKILTDGLMGVNEFVLPVVHPPNLPEIEFS
jgi:hypothetical protein